MITLAFAQMIYYVAVGLARYGGDDGLTIYRRSQFGGLIDLSNKTAFYYFCLVLLAGAIYLVWRLVNSRFGMVIQGSRSNDRRMRAIGFPTFRYKLACFVIAGMMCGLAGAYMSLAYSTSWAENMTAGRGWIALALVVFATWRPVWLLIGAYLFGGIMYGSLAIQAAGAISLFGHPVVVPSQLVSALPYLATIVVLVVISRDKVKIRLNAPACLGRPFHAAG